MTPSTRHPIAVEAPTRLDAIVRAWLGQSWSATRQAIRTGKIWHDGAPATDEGQLLTAGTLEFRPNTPRVDRAANRLSEADVIAHTHDYVVVRKPEGLMTVPFDNERDTLESRVRRWLEKRHQLAGRPYLGWVHRLDKETSGLVVFATSMRGKQVLQVQFQEHLARRVYHAIVIGRPLSGTIESELINDRGDSRRGSLHLAYPHVKRNPGPTQHAVTHVQALAYGARLSQVICHLETGRTHQIRIHLSETGTPIAGDPVYGALDLPRSLEAPRMCLHAVELSFEDPATRQRVTFTDPLPPAFGTYWQRVEGTALDTAAAPAAPR